MDNMHGINDAGPITGAYSQEIWSWGFSYSREMDSACSLHIHVGLFGLSRYNQRRRIQEFPVPSSPFFFLLFLPFPPP